MITRAVNAWRRYRSWRRLKSLNVASGLGEAGWILYGLVRATRPETCVEIGSARGKSTCFIGYALKENGLGKLYAIDPHAPTAWNDIDSVDTLDMLKKNIRLVDVAKHVEIVRAVSTEAAKEWRKPIDLLFIDGDHSYEGVKKDWELFSPFVSRFGFVIFHDTLWDLDPDPRFYRKDMGVPRFVEELRRQGYPVITSDKNFGVSIVQPAKGGVPLSGAGKEPAA